MWNTNLEEAPFNKTVLVNVIFKVLNKERWREVKAAYKSSASNRWMMEGEATDFPIYSEVVAWAPVLEPFQG